MMKTPGGPAGFAAEVVREAARRRKIELEWVPLPGGPEAELKAGSIDIYPIFANTPERRGRIYMSQPWWESPVALIVDRRKGFTTHQDVDGRPISVVDFSVTEKMAHTLFPHSQYVLKIPYEDVLLAACDGNADAALLTLSLYLELVQNGVHGCEGVPLAPLLIPDAEISYSIGARKGAEAAADEIAAEIVSLTYDGTIARLAAKSGELVTNQAQLIRSLSSTRRNRNLFVGLAVGLGALALFVVAQNRRVKRARAAAERARKAESEFLANMSHEIRTPMNGVLGMLGLAMELNPDPELHEYLETANHSAVALMSVLNDILDFSKIDAGRLDLEWIDFSPRQMLEQCVKTLAQEARRKGLNVVLEVHPDLPEICLGDPNRLRQVVLNLLNNAIKFTERGSITITAEVGRLGTTDIALHFAVRDTGIGVPVSKQQTTFRAFSQADRSTTRRFGGTGLGLAIAGRLVELMQGRIWVQSEPGHGSTFHFVVVLGRKPSAAVSPAALSTSQSA
jgi:signal transduction histidine kinase